MKIKILIIFTNWKLIVLKHKFRNTIKIPFKEINPQKEKTEKNRIVIIIKMHVH